MTDCISRLITSLREVEVRAHDDKGFMSIHRGRNINNVRFWGTEEAWNFGYLRWPMEPTAALATPDRDVALRWLICCTGNLYREKQKWRYLLPLRNIPGFANGWTAEQTSEQTITTTIKATGRLIRPDGTPVDMDMSTAFPHAPELAALSHLMRLAPDQVLDAYLTPDGGPLNHLLEHGDPIAAMGQDFQHILRARGGRISPREDGFILPSTYCEWVPHFWIEDGSWRYGHTERGEKRTPEILSTDRDIVLRWIALELLNTVRSNKGWPSILTYKTNPAILPGWQVQKLYNDHGSLISPDNIRLPMVMHTIFPRHEKLNTLSHLIPLTLAQEINSLLVEDGGNLHDHLTREESS